MKSLSAITLALTSGLIYLLFREAWKPARQNEDGTFVLRYGRGILILGVVCGVLAPGAILALALGGSVKSRSDLFIVLGLLAFFAILGWWFILEARGTRIAVTAEGVEARSPWGKPKRLEWHEVREVKYAQTSGYLVLSGGAGVRIRISAMMTGLPTFVASMKDHLAPDLYRLALMALEDRAWR